MVDSAFLDDAGAMFPWARVLGVSKGSIVIDLELQPGTEPTAEMVQEAAGAAAGEQNKGPQCTTSAVLRKPRPVSAEEDDEENFAAVEDPEEEETVEEEPASPTRAPHTTQEETYSISEDAAAREEDAMVAMASKNSVVEQEMEEASGVSPMALALGSCGGLAVLITAAFAAWLKLRVARERYAAKDVEKGVVVGEQKPAETKEDELDDNASTATPDSLAQSVESRRESLAMDIVSP